jgi:hypothetical protein
MAGGFRARYRQALGRLVRKPLPSDGFTQGQLQAAEARLRVKLPKALRDYYAVVGRHKLNQVHNRLLPPARLFLAGGHLAFMQENQAVVSWGARCERGEEDPAVFQAADPEAGPWYSEQARCSEFLTAMLYWQAVCGGLRHAGYAERVGAEVVRRVERSWPLIARIQDLSAYCEAGQAVCVLPDKKTALVHVGARTKRDFRDVEERLGVELDEA